MTLPEQMTIREYVIRIKPLALLADDPASLFGFWVKKTILLAKLFAGADTTLVVEIEAEIGQRYNGKSGHEIVNDSLKWALEILNNPVTGQVEFIEPEVRRLLATLCDWAGTALTFRPTQHSLTMMLNPDDVADPVTRDVLRGMMRRFIEQVPT